MSDVVAFWFICVVLGLIALPIAFAFFGRFPDAGAGTSFALGMVITGYLYFILRVAHVLPYGRGGAILAVAILAVVSSGVVGRSRRFNVTLRRSWRGIVASLCLFTVFFFLFVVYRSYLPAIAGTEQPMDLMYLNATMKSPSYPPEDPWLAGHPASYYYFGYLQGGLVSQAAGVPASTGYNLTLAYTFGAAAAGIASVVFALACWAMRRARARWWAVAAGIAIAFLLFLGSLEGVFELAAAHGEYSDSAYGAFGVDFLLPCTPQQVAANDTSCYRAENTPRTSTWYPDEYFFWFRASRVMPGTITEFPAFSFILGDLHPHVMSIPLVLLALSLAAAVWRGRRQLSWEVHRQAPFFGLALALVFGALSFENAWDILTFTALLALAVVARNLRHERPGAALRNAVTFLGPVVAGAVLLYIPWYIDFRSQAGGLYPYVGAGTSPAHAFLQFGVLGSAGLLALTWARRPMAGANVRPIALAMSLVPLVPFALWLVLCQIHGNLSDAFHARTSGGWVTLALYGLSAWALSTAAVCVAWKRHAAAIVPALCAVAALLLFGTELFVVRDIFFASSPRMNTVFKLSYQAWILLAAGGAVALVMALRRARLGAPAGWLAAPVGLLACAGLVYTIVAVPNRTEGFRKTVGIDGLSALARSDPAQYALTQWVQQNVPPGDVIIESSGRHWGRDSKGNLVVTDPNVDYTDAASVSSRTGRPIPIGWYFHEIQWRGDTVANQAQFQSRQNLEDAVYTATTPAAAIAAMHEAGATFVVVGRTEQADFPGLMPKFDTFLDTVFSQDGLSVYALPQDRQVATS